MPVLVPARSARATGGQERAPAPPPSPEPRTAVGFGGVSGFSPLSTVTTVTTDTADTAATSRTEPSYWGWGGKKRPGSWNGHSGASR